MGVRCHRIGILLSVTGPYHAVARSMLNGAMLAIAETQRPNSGVVLEPVVVNPEGDTKRYADLSRALVDSGIRHVVGCYTSLSRKEVIPNFEKRDALLWYPSHYEGFETSNNVVYTGAVPNQHILPLIEYLVGAYGSRAFCVGSNYIWAWENNRILREMMMAGGGTVLAERYAPIGDTDLDQVVDAIIEARPNFVFSTLIGNSAYAFMERFRSACRARGIDQAASMPVASCTLSEPELAELGAGAVDGHLSSSVYFSSIASASNRAFVRRYEDAYPDGPSMSADAEASYVAVKLLGLALAEAGTEEINAVKAAVMRQRLSAPQGEIWIDPLTSHAHLTPRIGRSNADGGFDILFEAPGPVRPDPYLVRSAPRFAATSRSAHLRAIR